MKSSQFEELKQMMGIVNANVGQLSAKFDLLGNKVDQLSHKLEVLLIPIFEKTDRRLALIEDGITIVARDAAQSRDGVHRVISLTSALSANVEEVLDKLGHPLPAQRNPEGGGG